MAPLSLGPGKEGQGWYIGAALDVPYGLTAISTSMADSGTIVGIECCQVMPFATLPSVKVSPHACRIYPAAVDLGLRHFAAGPLHDRPALWPRCRTFRRITAGGNPPGRLCGERSTRAWTTSTGCRAFRELAESLKGMHILPGFRLEPVATEPLVASCVDLAFDENGRLYVAEMVAYAEGNTAKFGSPQSRVSLLEDTDGDGKFDKRTVFVEHLVWPTGLACFDGGVFIAARRICCTARTPTATAKRICAKSCSRASS